MICAWPTSWRTPPTRATMDRFKALDLKVETKPDMTPVSEADKARRGADPRPAAARQAAGRDPRRGVRHRGHGPAPLGDRPDRRHQELRARRPGLGDADLPDGGGRGRLPAGGRRGLGAGARPPLVGGEGRGRVHRAQPDLGDPAAGVSRSSRIPDASFAYSSLSGWEEQGRLDGFLDLTRACWRTRGYGDFWPYMMVAEGSVDICAEPELSLWDMAANAIIVTRRRAAASPAWTARRARTAATRRRPTACSTTSCSGYLATSGTDRVRTRLDRDGARGGLVRTPPLVDGLLACDSESPPTL